MLPIEIIIKILKMCGNKKCYRCKKIITELNSKHYYEKLVFCSTYCIEYNY